MKTLHTRQRLTALALILTLVLAQTFAPCSFRKAEAFTIGEEREIGEKLLFLVRSEFKFFDDPDIAQYINRLGNSILKVTTTQYFDYHFYIIDNKVFNAFAAPSGLIILHSGLVESMETEGELLGVLAHEVGHVTSRHLADRIEKSQKVTIGSLAMILAGIALGAGELSEAMIAGSLAAGASADLYFSRQNEEEADRLAFQWMHRMEQSPESLASMLLKMRRISLYSQGDVPPYLLTHPEPEKRLGYVLDLIALQGPGEYQPEDNFEFLRVKSRILSMTKTPSILLPRYLKMTNNASLELNNRTAFAYYGLSQAYLTNADFSKARETLLKVIEYFPDKPILLADLGLIAFQGKKYQLALELFEKSRKLDPESAFATFHLARTLEQTGDLKGAEKFYEQLLSVLPEYSRLHYHLAQVKAARGDKYSGHYHFGAYFWYTGERKNALFHLQEVMNNLPEENPTRQKAVELLQLARNIDAR